MFGKFCLSKFIVVIFLLSWTCLSSTEANNLCGLSKSQIKEQVCDTHETSLERNTNDLATATLKLVNQQYDQNHSWQSDAQGQLKWQDNLIKRRIKAIEKIKVIKSSNDQNYQKNSRQLQKYLGYLHQEQQDESHNVVKMCDNKGCSYKKLKAQLESNASNVNQDKLGSYDGLNIGEKCSHTRVKNKFASAQSCSIANYMNHYQKVRHDLHQRQILTTSHPFLDKAEKAFKKDIKLRSSFDLNEDYVGKVATELSAQTNKELLSNLEKERKALNQLLKDKSRKKLVKNLRHVKGDENDNPETSIEDIYQQQLENQHKKLLDISNEHSGFLEALIYEEGIEDFKKFGKPYCSALQNYEKLMKQNSLFADEIWFFVPFVGLAEVNRKYQECKKLEYRFNLEPSPKAIEQKEQCWEELSSELTLAAASSAAGGALAGAKYLKKGKKALNPRSKQQISQGRVKELKGQRGFSGGKYNYHKVISDKKLRQEKKRLDKAEKLLGRKLSKKEKQDILRAHYLCGKHNPIKNSLAKKSKYSNECLALKADILRVGLNSRSDRIEDDIRKLFDENVTGKTWDNIKKGVKDTVNAKAYAESKQKIGRIMDPANIRPSDFRNRQDYENALFIRKALMKKDPKNFQGDEKYVSFSNNGRERIAAEVLKEDEYGRMIVRLDTGYERPLNLEEMASLKYSETAKRGFMKDYNERFLVKRGGTYPELNEGNRHIAFWKDGIKGKDSIPKEGFVYRKGQELYVEYYDPKIKGIVTEKIKAEELQTAIKSATAKSRNLKAQASVWNQMDKGRTAREQMAFREVLINRGGIDTLEGRGFNFVSDRFGPAMGRYVKNKNGDLESQVLANGRVYTQSLSGDELRSAGFYNEGRVAAEFRQALDPKAQNRDGVYSDGDTYSYKPGRRKPEPKKDPDATQPRMRTVNPGGGTARAKTKPSPAEDAAAKDRAQQEKDPLRRKPSADEQRQAQARQQEKEKQRRAKDAEIQRKIEKDNAQRRQENHDLYHNNRAADGSKFTERRRNLNLKPSSSNPYEAVGIPKNTPNLASELRKQERRIRSTYHPDKYESLKSDIPDAVEARKKVTDEQKRLLDHIQRIRIENGIK